MEAKLVGWTELKAFVDARNLSIQWLDLGDVYWLKAFDGLFALETTLHKTLHSTETGVFEASYKAAGNKTLEPKNVDKRTVVHATPRKRGLYTCFTSGADDQTDQSQVGGANGVLLELHHQLGQPTSQSIYFDLNTIANESHAHSGYMQWKSALNDAMTLTTVPKLTTTSAGSNTNYNLYGGYLVIPAAGNGTLAINDADRVLVEVPVNEYGNRASAGYWDATYNTTTKQFDNVTANLSGTGQFNMFTVEVTLDRFLNRIMMLGDWGFSMDTYDASMIGHNMRIKVTLETRGADHEWWWCGVLKPYRKKTV